MSILSGARNAKNSSLAQQIFDRIETNFPDDESALISARVLLANTFALNGDKKSAKKTRMQLQQLRTRKVAGLAWTVIDGRVFVSERETIFPRVTSDCLSRNFEHMTIAILSGKRSSKN